MRRDISPCHVLRLKYVVEVRTSAVRVIKFVERLVVTLFATSRVLDAKASTVLLHVSFCATL